MRILRLIVVGGVFGLSILAIGFVSADRLTHLPTPAAPQMARAPALGEPQGTGSILPSGLPEDVSAGGTAPPRPTGVKRAILKGPDARSSDPKNSDFKNSDFKNSAARAPVTKTASAKPAPAKPRSMDGFDTERLNALLRGDPITPPRR